MSNCYKCGRELPGTELECEPGECEDPKTSAELEAAEREADDETKWVEIDWDKVTTLEQLKAVVRVAGYGRSFTWTIRISTRSSIC